MAYQEFTETGEWFLSHGKHPTAKQNPLFLAAGAQPAPKQEPESGCWCDAIGIGEPGVSCGDCPTRDYKAMLTAAPVQARPAKPLTCQWAPMDDDTGSWESACGQAWSFIEDGPAENNCRFCHGCGKPIEIKEQS